VEVDTNYWKSFVHERLATAMGDAGCLSIFGPAGRGTVQHRLFADHLTVEYRVRTEGRGRTVDEWKLPGHKPDNPACERSEQTGREPGGRVPKGCDAEGAHNHWFDCVVGCAAAASMQGVERVGAAVQASENEKKRLRLSEMQKKKPRSGRQGRMTGTESQYRLGHIFCALQLRLASGAASLAVGVFWRL